MTPADVLLALLANTAWAFNFIAGKAGVEHFPPLFFTTLRFAIVLTLLFPWLRWVPGEMTRVFQVGFVMGVGHFSLMFAGLAAGGDVSSVAIATQLYVPFSAVLAVIFLKERMELRRIAGISVAFGGVVVIGFDPIVFHHLDALLLISGAAMAMAVATILMRGMRGVGVFTLQAWIALIAAPSLLLLSLLFEQNQLASLQTAGWWEMATPAYSAVGGSLVGHGIVYYLLRRHPVTLIAPFMLLTPVLAVIFGVTFWGDSLSWKLVLGGMTTLAGVAVINMRQLQSRPKQA